MEENRRAKERNRKEMDRRRVEQKRQSLARIGIGIELKSEGKAGWRDERLWKGIAARSRGED